MKKLCAIGLVFIIFYINFTSISASHNNSGRFVSIYPAVNEEIDAQKYKERLLAQVESEKILLHLKIRNSENALLIKERKGKISQLMLNEHEQSCKNETVLWHEHSERKNELERLAIASLGPIHKAIIDLQLNY